MRFALPSLVSMSANAIYNLCDSIFIGQGCGPLAIAGLAITFPIITLSSALGAMVGVGSAAQTSVAMGENRREHALRIFGNMLMLDVCISLLFMFLGLVFLDPLLHLLGASELTLPYARSYISVLIAANLITHVFLSLCDQLRATGNPQRSMRAHLIVIILNLILDPLFIFGFHLGVRGAALATVLSQLCGLLYAGHFFLDDSNFVHFSRKCIRFQASIIRGIISIGLSPFFTNVCGSIIIVLINRALVEQGGAEGDLCVGVYGVTNRINALLVMMVSGFSQGMQPIVGYNLGARQMSRVHSVMRLTYICATTITTVGYLVICCIPAQLANAFTDDSQMIQHCVPAFRIMLCALPLVGGQIITTSFFMSLRKPRISITLSLTRQLILLLPLILILPPIFGITGVWISIPIAEAVSALLAIILLCREVKRCKSQST